MNMDFKKFVSLSITGLIVLSSSTTLLAEKENYKNNTQLEQSGKFSDEQKNSYYKEYLIIASEVSRTAGQQINVLPINEFKESDWIHPSEFKKLAIELANYEVQISPNGKDSISPFSSGSATKNVSIKTGSITDTLSITGSFTTQYNSFYNRQIFSGVNSITSKLVSNSNGSWRQIDYDKTILDGGRTYKITVSGTYSRLGVSTNIYASTEFYCSQTGGIS